jgi:hypothetical protein
VSDEDRDLAKNQICSKRLQLDDQIVAMDGGCNFSSQWCALCITMVETNARRPKSDKDDEAASGGPTLFPGVQTFRETSKSAKETIFAALHDADMEPTIAVVMQEK